MEGSTNDVIIYETIAANLWLYMSPIILILGTFGNALSFLTWSRTVFRGKPISVYFLTLAFVDTLVLYTGLLRHWIVALSAIDIRHNSSLSCKIHAFLVYWSITFASWVLVALTIDRFFHVKRALFARRWFTHKTALGLLVAFGMMCASVDCHFFISHDLIRFELENSSEIVYECTQNREWVLFMFDVWPWIDYVFYSALPSSIILICNISIIIHVTKSRLMQNSYIFSQESHSHFNTMTAILLCVSIAFLVLTTPNAVYFIIQRVWRFGDPVSKAKSHLLYTITALLTFINNSANFLFYCVSGRQFRKEFKKMIHAKKVSPSQERTAIS